MIIVNVTTIKLTGPGLEGHGQAFILEICNDAAPRNGVWREELFEEGRVISFIRGVKAGAVSSGIYAVHVNQPEWNV